jgi:hypothetical protein
MPPFLHATQTNELADYVGAQSRNILPVSSYIKKPGSAARNDTTPVKAIVTGTGVQRPVKRSGIWMPRHAWAAASSGGPAEDGTGQT